jgi:hypothetical protein
VVDVGGERFVRVADGSLVNLEIPEGLREQRQDLSVLAARGGASAREGPFREEPASTPGLADSPFGLSAEDGEEDEDGSPALRDDGADDAGAWDAGAWDGAVSPPLLPDEDEEVVLHPKNIPTGRRGARGRGRGGGG